MLHIEKLTRRVTGEESQTFTKLQSPRDFSQELADQTTAKTPMTIGLDLDI